MTAAGREYDVLVVDDDFMVARIHTRYLATVDGFHVVDTVHTGTGRRWPHWSGITPT